MKKGEGFGEKALLYNTARALTTTAYSQSLFLVVLQKEDFAIV
jgi:CRP-like cAMP-binding protein